MRAVGAYRVVEQDAATAPLPGFEELVGSCTRHDDHAPFGEHVMLLLEGRQRVQHARFACLSDDGLVGYAVLSEGLTAWSVELAVAPGSRRAGVGGALLEGVREHVASHGGGLLRGWAHGAGPAVERLVHDWRTARSLEVLERTAPSPPPPRVPSGTVLRDLDPGSGADRDAWLSLTNAAFAGHPDNGGWTRDDLDWRMDADWTDGRRLPVVEGSEGLLAGVWTKVERSVGGTTGELYVVAVHPAVQGRGLGRVVVAQALRQLAAQGHDRTVLYVDSANATARRLYATAGFSAHHVDRCYELTVPAAAATAPLTSEAHP